MTDNDNYMLNNNTLNRQMRGEELQGLSIEQLQQLEKSLEVGLRRVIEKKVSLYAYTYIYIFPVCKLICSLSFLHIKLKLE